MKFESPLDIFILFIIFIKIVFILSAIGHVILTHLSAKKVNTTTTNDVIDAKLLYWKERTEFIFTICMSILLIYYFKPGNSKPLTSETSLLFYLFGWILIITAKWSTFITGAKWYKGISSA